MKILGILFFNLLLSYILVSCERDNYRCANPINEVGRSSDNQFQILSKRNDLSAEKLQNILNTYFLERSYMFSIDKTYRSKNIDVYTAKIRSENLPNNIKKDYLVVDFRDNKLQYILPLELNYFFRYDKTIMFGGIYNYREYDYYAIYKIQNDKINKELDSRDIDGKPIIIGYYKDDECIDYLPDRLTFYSDKSTKEILFKGLIDNRCKNGSDKVSDSGINNRTETNIYFKYTNSQWIYNHDKSNYLFW